jgi:hypothetical protein
MVETFKYLISLISDKKVQVGATLLLSGLIIGFLFGRYIVQSPEELEAQKRVNVLVKEISEMGVARTNGVYFFNSSEYRILQSKLDELEVQSKIADQSEEWEKFIQTRRAKKEPTVITQD